MYFYKNEFSAVLTRSCALRVLNRTTPSKSIQFINNILTKQKETETKTYFLWISITSPCIGNFQVWPDNKTAFPDFLRNNTWNQWKEWIVNQSKEIDFDGLWIVGVTHIPSKMGHKIETLCGKILIFFYLLECVCQTDAR